MDRSRRREVDGQVNRNVDRQGNGKVNVPHGRGRTGQYVQHEWMPSPHRASGGQRLTLNREPPSGGGRVNWTDEIRGSPSARAVRGHWQVPCRVCVSSRRVAWSVGTWGQ